MEATAVAEGVPPEPEPEPESEPETVPVPAPEPEREPISDEDAAAAKRLLAFAGVMGVFDAVTTEAALQLCHDALQRAGGNMQDASERLWEQHTTTDAQRPHGDPDPTAPSLRVEPSSLAWSIVLEELNTRKLRLTNPSARRAVCCRVQTAPRYAANPVTVCIPANGSAEVEITMFAMAKLPKANDRKDQILIKATWQEELQVGDALDLGRFWLGRQGARDDVSQMLLCSDIVAEITPYRSSSDEDDDDTSDDDDDDDDRDDKATCSEDGAEREEAHEAGSSELKRSRTLSVESYKGHELKVMYHGTDSRAAQLIATSQRFRPSIGGLLGDGVYVTQTRQKAEGYRVHHPNAASVGAKAHNSVLPNGEKDPGCILQFKVRLGACKSFTREDDESSLSSWHDPDSKTSAVLTPTKSMRRAADQKGVQTIRFNSAHSGGCTCCPRHGEDCPGSPVNGHRPMPGTIPCEGRCKVGFRVCKSANSSWEEFCVHNPSRITQIEILDGPGELVGYGREHWSTDQATRDTACEKLLVVLDEQAEQAEKAVLAGVQSQLSRENAAFITITGAIHPKCNGLYRQALVPHKGIPRYESEHGWYLYYHENLDNWRISSQFKPDSTGCYAYISSEVTKLPTGEQTWKEFDTKWVDRQLIITLWSDDHKETAEQQAAEYRTQFLSSQAKAACAQLEAQGVAGIRVENGPGKDENNGVFVLMEERHEGWPRFQNENGVQLFRQLAAGDWYISTDFTPDSFIGSIPKAPTADGTIPFCSAQWLCWAKGASGGYADHAMTLTPLSIETVAAEQEKTATTREAALNAAHEQLGDVGAVFITGCRTRLCDGMYFKVSDGALLRTTTPSWLRSPQNRPADHKKNTLPKFRSTKGIYLFHHHPPHGAVHSWNISADLENISEDTVLAQLTGSAEQAATLPLGKSKWNCRGKYHHITASLISAEDAAERMAIEEQSVSVALANALDQLKDVTAVKIEEKTAQRLIGTAITSRIGGVYEPISGQGDPSLCFRNEHGMSLWYCKERISWHIGDSEGAEVDPMDAMLVATADGRLVTDSLDHALVVAAEKQQGTPPPPPASLQTKTLKVRARVSCFAS